MISLEFLITSLVVVLIPGTGVIYTVSTGLAQGRKASVYAAIGCTAGIVPHLMATVLGLAAVMHASALAFQVLKYAGVVYLFTETFSAKLLVGICHLARPVRICGGWRSFQDLCRWPGHQGRPAQHPEPQADHLLLGLSAPVR